MPTVSSVSGCIASSSRRPSTYGQSSDEKPKNPGFWAGNWFGSSRVVNSTNFACPVGSTRLSKDASGKPIHGITIDQNRPRARAQRVAEPSGIVLVHAELVKVVVGRRRLDLCLRLVQAERGVA